MRIGSDKINNTVFKFILVYLEKKKEQLENKRMNFTYTETKNYKYIFKLNILKPDKNAL